LKTISIRQPWAHAIIHFGKRHENRTWKTDYRGPVLLHAAKGMSRAEYEEFALWWINDFPHQHDEAVPMMMPTMGGLLRGGIVGRAKIVDCVTKSDSPWFFGPFAFVLDKVEELPFVAYRGELGLFDVPDELLRA
jgi:hypothetical protein